MEKNIKKFDVAFVDLDDTIFDTRRFKEDIYNVFKSSGISREDFSVAYKRAAEKPEFGYFRYTFEGQIQAVRDAGFKVADEALKSLQDLLKNNYLISDVKDFLKYLKSIKVKLILLTAGVPEFQSAKIESIKIADYFDEMIKIEGGKNLVLKPFVEAGDKIAFINDNLKENIMIKNSFPGVTVLTVFNPSYWTEKDCQASGLPYFKTLSEIKNYVIQL